MKYTIPQGQRGGREGGRDGTVQSIEHTRAKVGKIKSREGKCSSGLSFSPALSTETRCDAKGRHRWKGRKREPEREGRGVRKRYKYTRMLQTKDANPLLPIRSLGTKQSATDARGCQGMNVGTFLIHHPNSKPPCSFDRSRSPSRRTR